MYYSLGNFNVLTAINKVCKIKSYIYDLSSESLINAYTIFLQKKSIFNLPPSWIGSKIINFEEIFAISPQLYTAKKNFFCKNTLAVESKLHSNFFFDAFENLKDQCFELYELACFIIKVIVVNQLAEHTNGTVQESIGCSIMDFKDHYTQQDFIELIVHQLTHMLLFIDDMSESHIKARDKNIMIDTNLKYKLGGKQFPLYLAFHSYLVGVEVLLFRRHTHLLDFEGNYHGNTDRIIRVCFEFLKSLSPHMNLFNERGQFIFSQASALLDNFKI